MSRLAETFRRLPDVTRGIIWMVAATFLLTCMSATIKLLGKTVHPLEILFFRTALGILWMLPFIWRTGLAGLGTRRLPIYLCRAAAGLIGGIGAFWAFTLIPLAEATAIIFTRPLWATIIAIVLLGEVVGARRWAAILVGFVGVLVMVRPGLTEVETGTLLAMSSALAAAAAALFGRVLAATEPPDRMTVYFMVLQAPVAAILAAFVWVTPRWEELALLFVMAGFGALGQRAIARAYSCAGISVILPFDYLRLPFAALIGIALFGDVPLIWTWIGGTIIFASAVTIARRESAR